MMKVHLPPAAQPMDQHHIKVHTSAGNITSEYVRIDNTRQLAANLRCDLATARSEAKGGRCPGDFVNLYTSDALFVAK